LFPPSNPAERPDVAGDEAAVSDAVRAGGGWRRIAAFVGGMLLAGAAIGVGAALLRGGDEPRAGATATERPVPTATDPVPAPSGPPQASISNSELAPRELAITDQGTSALLTWAAPTASVDSLVVVRLVDGESPAVVANLAPGAVE